MTLRFSIPSDSSAYHVTFGIVISSVVVYLQYFLNEDKSLIVQGYFTVEDKRYLKIR